MLGTSSEVAPAYSTGRAIHRLVQACDSTVGNAEQQEAVGLGDYKRSVSGGAKVSHGSGRMILLRAA